MRLALATAFIFLTLPTTANAQGARVDALGLKSGTRARIADPVTDSRYTLITVQSTSPDSLRYSVRQGLDTRSLPWQQVHKMDVSMGSHRHFGRGLGIGLLVGTVAGALIGASFEPSQDFSRGFGAAIGAAYLGAIGGAGGAVIGYAWRSENWVPVTLPQGTLAHP